MRKTINSITLQNMEFFITVAKYSNMRMAAEELFVTQPLLSQRISSLEGELGLKLFFRTKKGLELTDAGMDLKESWEKIINEIYASIEKCSKVQEQNMVHITLGVFEALWSEKYFALYQKIQNTIPDYALEFQPIPLQEWIHSLENREVDVLLVPDYGQLPEYKNLKKYEVAKSPLYVTFSLDHPFYEKKIVKWHDLVQTDILVPKALGASDYVNFIKQQLAPNDISFRILTFKDINAVKLKLYMGKGVLIAVSPLSEEESKCLTYKRIADSCIDLVLLWKKDAIYSNMDDIIMKISCAVKEFLSSKQR